MIKKIFFHVIFACSTIAVINGSQSEENSKQQTFINNNTGKLFSDRPNQDLYWEALIQAAKNNIENGKAIAQLIKAGGNTDINFSSSWKLDKPQTIEGHFDKLFISSVDRKPQTLSFLGLFESIGIKDHNAYLDNYSPKETLDSFEETKHNLEALRNFSPDGLSSEQFTSYKTFLWQLDYIDEGEHFLFHGYPVNQMFGVIQDIIQTFTIFHKIEELQDVENYNKRLACLSTQLDQAIELMQYQKERGIFPPRFAIEKSLHLMGQLIEPSVTDNLLYTYLVQNLDSMDVSDKNQILDTTQTVLSKSVYPALKKFHAFCEDLLNHIQTNHGVWALPDGDQFYAFMLKMHTTTDLTPDEIHELGLAEVQKIQNNIKKLLIQENRWDPNKGIGQQIQDILKDDDLYFPNTEEGQKECLAEFKSILERSRQKLWPLFGMKPKKAVEVLPLPKELEEGSPAAYYFLPSIDGSRPGVFYVNLRNMREHPKFEMETLAIHEAEPGHHFQLSIQYDMDIPILRKLGSYTAYVEGWALYAEMLAYENGFYSSSLSELGHLKYELLRAVRLVVDTGIHHKRWTREQAIDYMIGITGTNKESVTTEVERYFVLPGQACAYKIGQLKILELREKAKEKLGDKFRIQDFHDVVLKLGAVPLQLLEEAVDNYIADK